MAFLNTAELLYTIVNQMLLKHRAKLEASQTAMEEAQTRMRAEQRKHTFPDTIKIVTQEKHTKSAWM